jgi:hypothetical protein
MSESSIEDLDLHAVLDENKESKVPPHCLVCVDFQHNVHLVAILNESEISRSWMSSDLHEYLDGENWEDDDPGLYTVDLDVHSWQDNTPDSCDWNSELMVSNVIPYKSGSVPGATKFPTIHEGYVIERCSMCGGSGLVEKNDGGPLRNERWEKTCGRCKGVGYARIKIEDIPIVTERAS